jgi:NifB/MoaA-like Fe-S oxidoreductase
LRDVIDVQVYASEPELTFLVERDGKRLERTAQRRYGQPLGLEFASELFDEPLHVCRNACDFCFVSQMPPGMRASLYVKDDDYRLSFLHGNYITLTNLDTAAWERIAEQHLSPLYVSVHATEPGIEVHTQAVLMPGHNDGEHLERTISELAALYPGVRSLCVVPVGLTRLCRAGLRPYTGDESLAVLEQILTWQRRLRVELGVGFVYPTDEWYLRAGWPVPPLAVYDGQLPFLVENGVGLVRRFMDDWPVTHSTLAELGGIRQLWVTGTLFAPLLQEYAAAFTRETGIVAEVLPVANRTLGETITVAGLLTAGDVLAALPESAPGPEGVLVLPGVMCRGPWGRTLDGLTSEDIARVIGQPGHVVV